MNVSEQAFSVFCDEVVRDTVEKNKALEKKNEALEPLRHLLQTVKVSHHEKVLMEINLTDNDKQDGEDDDDEYLTYSIHDADKVPFDLIKDLDVRLSGMLHLDTILLRNKPPNLTVLQDTEIPSAEFVMYLNRHKVTGILTDFKGSLAKLQDMIGTDAFRSHYIHLGMVDVETGMPSGLDFGHGDTLNGAMFTLTKVEVLKECLEETLSNVQPTLNAAALEQVEELKMLAEANKDHERLSEVADELKTLVHRNASLAESAARVQAVQARSPGGPPIHFKLETGRKHAYTGGPYPFWLIEPLADENCSIPITSISRIKIFLAGMSWMGSSSGHLSLSPPFFTRDAVMIVQLNSKITAMFAFDGSISESDFDTFDGNIAEYIADTILRTTPLGPNERITGLMEPLDPEPEWTMRLLCLQVPLYEVQTHLDLLGVDTTTDEEEDI